MLKQFANKGRNSILLRCLSASFLLALLPLNAVSEPLGYVNRPDRGDVGVFDARSKVGLGGIALNARAYTVKVSPNGRFAYVGLEGLPMMMIDTLDAKLLDLGADLGTDHSEMGVPQDVTAIVFHPTEDLAYVASDGDLYVIDTTTHRVVDAWELTSVGVVEELLIDTHNNLLVALDQDDNLVAWNMLVGQLFLVPGLAGEIKSMKIDSQGGWYILDDEYLTRYQARYTFSELGGHDFDARDVSGFLPFDVIQDQVGIFGEPLQFDILTPDKVVFLGFSSGVIAVSCFDTAADEETHEIIETQVNCFSIPNVSGGAAGQLELTAFRLDSFPGSRGLENQLADLQRSEDQSEIYAVGRRAVAAINTETLAVIKVFNMRSGGGSLGNLSFGNKTESCIAQSSSIPSLIGEVNALNTSANSINVLSKRLNDALFKLAEDDIVGARNALKNFVGTVVWRSNLSPGDKRHVEPAPASSMACAAGDLISRLDAY